MSPLYFIIILSLFQMNFATAQLDDNSLPYNYYSSIPRTARPWSPQFEAWYPDHRKFLANVSQGICNLTLRDYRAAYEAPRGSVESTKILSICYRHEACILSQYGDNFQANAQGASVVLGLFPTLMSVSIGPSVSEIYLLSIHRPILAMLITLGSPTYQVSKLFEYHHPGLLLHPENNKLQIFISSKSFAMFLSILEYFVALLASGTVLYTTVEMGQKSILAWGCTTQFAELSWAVFALVPQILVTGGYAVLSRNRHTSQPTQHQRQHRPHIEICQATLQRMLTTFAIPLLDVIKREVTVCAKQELRRGVMKQGPRPAVVLNIIAQCMCFILFAFGTFMFSSVLFVTVTDVFVQIYVRLFFSALFCRLILVIELAGLRSVNPQNGIVT
ncbi:hypothetical protein F4781DRAFT_417179 [Annulohypoxylon bovei var. microspora]|nr:hypothetical protein F4781DRAFT_417179 [Annulohypoxylon bovei var. microspora]